MNRPRQVIWLTAEATTFAALCEECLAHPSGSATLPAYRAAKVTGRLRADADVGFVGCSRGHRISVRRNRRTAA